jgi:cysteine desulfuration protein SufE
MLDFQEKFAELFELDDSMDKYEYIIEYGAVARPVFEVKKIDSNLVIGCTSNLWVEKIDDDIQCYGESLIVQGLASMICDWYNQASIEQRDKFSLEQLTALGLAPMLSMGRQNGIANLIARIKKL